MNTTSFDCPRAVRHALLSVGGLLLVGASPLLAQSDNISFSGRIGFRGEYMRNENFAENDATSARGKYSRPAPTSGGKTPFSA